MCVCLNIHVALWLEVGVVEEVQLLCETNMVRYNLYNHIWPHIVRTNKTCAEKCRFMVLHTHTPLHFDRRSSAPQIVELVTALLHYFQATASLPTAKEAAHGDTVGTGKCSCPTQGQVRA